MNKQKLIILLKLFNKDRISEKEFITLIDENLYQGLFDKWKFGNVVNNSF